MICEIGFRPEDMQAIPRIDYPGRTIGNLISVLERLVESRFPYSQGHCGVSEIRNGGFIEFEVIGKIYRVAAGLPVTDLDPCLCVVGTPVIDRDSISDQNGENY